MLKFQLGKAGVKETTINALETTFKKNELVKIKVLKTTDRSKEKLNQLGDQLCSELSKRLNKKFSYKLIGFTLTIKKW